MLMPQDDIVKRRLIDHRHIAAAVDFLSARGVDAETITVELARAFYVDMDELNAVLAARGMPPAFSTTVQDGGTRRQRPRDMHALSG